MVYKPGDLQDTSAPDKDDNNFFNITIVDLDPSVVTQSYLDVELAWLYADKKKGPNEDGVSAYSTPIRISLPFETLKAPRFLSADLTVFQGKIRAKWVGTDEDGDPYLGLKHVEVFYRESGQTTWISAGTLSVAGYIDISGVPKKYYQVKLVAVSVSGAESPDSAIQTIQLLGTGPNQPGPITAAWVGTKFTLTFTHDPAASGNEYLSYYKVKLVGTNSVEYFDRFEVKATGTTQSYEIEEAKWNWIFGQMTEPGFSGEVVAYSIYNDQSLPREFGLTSYVSPLEAPTITLTGLVGGYSVKVSDQATDAAKKALNLIVVQEVVSSAGSDPGTGYATVASQYANPVFVPTGTSSGKRWVRVLVYDTAGGYPKNLDGTPKYSVAQSVTPTISSGDDNTPPGVPSVTAGTPTSTTIPLTITVTDADTKTVYVRYRPSGASRYSYDTLTTVVKSPSTNSWILTGLTPNTTYNIGVSGGDNFNNYSSYSTDINVATLSTNPPAPTSLATSSNPSGVGVLASWTAASGAVRYRVQLFENVPNTLIETSEVFSTNASFTGLKASTVYRVEVKTIDQYNSLSTGTLSGTFTTNAAASISDGLAPSSSPTPVVRPLYGALEIRWSAITNSDIVTYEVHASTSSGFTPSSGTLVGEVTGTFFILKTISGTALTYGTTYYIKLIAKDLDGSASAGTQASGTPSQVDNGDLAANSIRSNVIEAGSISASEIDASALLANNSVVVGSKVAVITTATVSGGNIVYTTSAAHGFLTSELVNITGMWNTTTNTEATLFNNKWPATGRLITSVTTNTFTVSNTGINATGSASYGRASVVKSNAIRIDSSSSPNKIYAGTGTHKNSNTGFYLDSDQNFSIGDRLHYTKSTNTLQVEGIIKASSGDLVGSLTVNNGTMKIGTDAGGTGNHGLFVNTNNYWYNTGAFKVGGANNGLTVNGDTVSIVSTSLTIKTSAVLEGNLQVSGSIYTGAAQSSGARVVVNSTGLTAFDASSSSNSTGITTRIYGDAASGGYTFVTNKALLGAIATSANNYNYWTVESGLIRSTSAGGTLTLNSGDGVTSSNISIVNSAGTRHYRLTAPISVTGTEPVTGLTNQTLNVIFFAGAQTTAGNAPTAAQILNSSIKITDDGKLYAKDAYLSGTFSVANGGKVGDWNITGGNIVSTNGSVTLEAATGKITGTTLETATIIGSTIKTGLTATERRIEITNAENSYYGTASYVLFQPASTDTTVNQNNVPQPMTIPGYIGSGPGLGIYGNIGLKIAPPTGVGWINPSIELTSSPSLSTMKVNAQYIQITSAVWTRLGGWVSMENGYDHTTPGIRNISSGTTSPTGGEQGDVYIQI